jgi:hypothetical protein
MIYIFEPIGTNLTIHFNENGDVVRATEYSKYLEIEIDVTKPLNEKIDRYTKTPAPERRSYHKAFLEEICDWYESAISQSIWAKTNREFEYEPARKQANG